jgi:sugar phosphate isomerase/epimerase
MDPSHGTLLKNDIPWVIRQWGKKIRHSHLKDSVGLPGHDGETFIFCLLGEGQVDWPGFFSAMQEIDYKGFYSVEFESFFYWEKVLKKDMLEAAKISWTQIQSLLSESAKTAEAS